MEIVLNRKGGVSVRDQLVAQLELRILGGQIGSGEKLPSVRALGRRLRVHPNTVSAAYRCLEAAGRVVMRRGAGVFVRAAGPTTLESARDVDEMIQVALAVGRRRGFSTAEIREAVERWLTAPATTRVVVVDRAASMAELLAAELGAVVDLPVQARGLLELEGSPGLLEGALAVSLPYHTAALRAAAPRGSVLRLTLHVDPAVREAIRNLPAGAIVLVISHAETVLPVADKLVRSLRGTDVLVETRLLRDRSWRRLLPAADLVFADVLAAPAVGRVRRRSVQVFRMLGDETLARVARSARAGQEAARSTVGRRPKASPATRRRK